METSPPMLTLSYPRPDVAVVAIDDPHKGVNVLSSSVLDELESCLDEAAARPTLAGLIIISGKADNFIAGADLREFVADINAPSANIVQAARRGQQLFGRLAKLPLVTIAAIHGTCLGGGLELAIWCDRRLATNSPATTLAFPEVKLGLFPGWGGTARAPRVVGLGNAVELITGGEPVDASAAAAMGLIDELIFVAANQSPHDALLEAAMRRVDAELEDQLYLSDRQQWSAPLPMSEAELEFLGATASAFIQGQTKGHYPAPTAALEVMLTAAGVDVDQACQIEAEAFPEQFGSAVNRALLNVFFLRDQNKKQTTALASQAAPLQTAAVIGAGAMGQGIAAACLKRGVPVRLMDRDAEATARGVQGVLNEASYDRRLKGPNPTRAMQLASLLAPTRDPGQLADVDVAIEAVYENLEVKQDVYQRVESSLKPSAILTTNTSTIPLAQLGARLQRPAQFCGLHFFNPVRRMPLVEVIRGPSTSEASVASAVAFALRIGKSPIVVGDGPGFLVNRVLGPYMDEALALASEGVPFKAIDRAAERFGMPLGPIALYDTVGLDVAYHAGQVMREAFPDRVVESPLVAALVEAGRLGLKTGGGFYDYGGKRRDQGVESESTQRLLAPHIDSPIKMPGEQIVERLMYPMLLEATRVLDDGVAQNVRDVDLALIYGIGFPPFRGGLFFWADSVGIPAIVERLAKYEHRGGAFRVPHSLSALAASGRSFYAGSPLTKESP
ncbi:MAG: enoyl-CoA hydratase/isomerase family protein [Planctomycetales bacterium]|nr:enoyl-CoA hydratase/isomerase family protein [Planctomycetales bacterium]